MKVSCITPTGDRPEALKLCLRWLENQTRLPDEWLVVDDSHTTVEQLQQTYDALLEHADDMPEALFDIKGCHLDPQPYNTQKRNLLEALKHVTGDIIVFIEDDDYYSPRYIEMLAHTFDEGYDAVGEIQAVYYNVYDRRYRRLRNTQYATLSQTAVTRNALPYVYSALTSRNVYNTTDVILWKALLDGQDAKCCLLAETPKISVGIKGMPGRPGIGIGHSQYGPWIPDPDGLHLLHFCGEDGKEYLPYYKKGEHYAVHEEGSENNEGDEETLRK